MPWIVKTVIVSFGSAQLAARVKHSMSKRTRVKKQWQDFEVAGSESEGMEDAQDSDSHLRTSAGLSSKAAAAGRGRPSRMRKAPAHASSDADGATDQDQQEDSDSSSDSDEEARPPRKKPARRGAAAAAGAPKQRKKQQPKQAQEKKGTRPMIGAVKARQLYILDDGDLARMKDVKHNHRAFGFFGVYGVFACTHEHASWSLRV